jgi:hypothetical protein
VKLSLTRKMSFFFPLQNWEQEDRIGPGWGWGKCWYQWEVTGKECKRVNMLQILYTHVSKCKNDTC